MQQNSSTTKNSAKLSTSTFPGEIGGAGCADNGPPTTAWHSTGKYLSSACEAHAMLISATGHIVGRAACLK